MTDEEIRQMWLKAEDRITDLMFRILALQTLLQEQGRFSSASVDERIQTIRSDWESRAEHHLRDQRERQAQEELRRLLESFEGPKQ